MSRVESHPKLNTVPPLLFRLVSALIVRENRVYDPNLCSQFFGCAISDVHIVQSINGSLYLGQFNSNPLLTADCASLPLNYTYWQALRN